MYMLQLIFFFQLIFVFLLYLGMAMYANELETKENKNFLQHAHEMFRHTFSYMKKKAI